MPEAVSDINVASEELLPTPAEIKGALPHSDASSRCVLEGRRALYNILDGKDPRVFCVVGPCSIHDLKAAKEYAERLQQLSEELEDTLYVLMRVYFSKPRTTLGWKGFINDPYLDDSFRIDIGIRQAREFLIELTEMGIHVATEALDPIIPQFLDDLLCWNAIGARTAESQTHRELASGLSTPVGIKNGTDGNIEVAINALQTTIRPHHFLGINQQGQVSVLRTRGNQHSHIILRGGTRPNYDSVSITLCEDELRKSGLKPNIVVDCSHGNSLKNYRLQPLVMKDCMHQIAEGNQSIIGVMLESNLKPGNQKMTSGGELEYGVSVTDSCLGWEETASLLREAREMIAPVLGQRNREAFLAEAQ